MATLVNCTIADFRERMLRWIYLNQPPPWEDVAGGSPMTWPFTTFVHPLHKTGDPGDAGGLTTNEADYTGYARITSTRGAVDYGISGGGTASPLLLFRKEALWPKNNDGVLQSMHAVSLGMRHSGTDYGIGRHVLAPPVDILPGDRPKIPGFSSKLSIDTVIASSTTAALFDQWEEWLALYIAHGGTLGYTGSFPGLTTNAPGGAYLTLSKTDPRSFAYPGVWNTVGSLNPTYEPTLAEYEGYSYVPIDRTVGGDLEAFEDGAGVWKVRNTVDLVFPDATAGSAGGTWPYAVLLLASATDSNFYATYSQELDTPFVVGAGGAGGLVIPAGDFELELR